jgi:anti-anti-sigma factor
MTATICPAISRFLLRDDDASAWVVALVGEFDGRWAATLSDQLDAAIDQARPGRRVLIDLSGTRFLHPTALAALVLAHGRANARGTTIALVAPPAQVRNLMESTHLDAVIPIIPNLEEALGTPPRSWRAQPTVVG